MNEAKPNPLQEPYPHDCPKCGNCAVVKRPGLDGVAAVEVCLECESGMKFLLDYIPKGVMRRALQLFNPREITQGHGIDWSEPGPYMGRPRRYELASERRRKRETLLFWRCYGAGMTAVAIGLLWLLMHRS